MPQPDTVTPQSPPDADPLASSQTTYLHLVSHASGELVELLARNALAQLAVTRVERRLWKMVRHLTQVPDILAAVAQRPGYVLHSISHTDVRLALEDGCRLLGVPCQFALEPLIGNLAQHLGTERHNHTSTDDPHDEDYFHRVEAMKYTLAHDDGLASDDLTQADVIVVGVSRATKTPTCMYLASRGIKAANVPWVPGVPLPPSLVQPGMPLIVALTVDPMRLSKIRSARLRSLDQASETDYTDIDALRRELLAARRLFELRRWPVIDVTHQSIEQTAALIIELLQARTNGQAKPLT